MSRRSPTPTGCCSASTSAACRVSLWINPYIGQRSPLFTEAAAAGHLVRRADGSVWQWDLWVAGMAVVDFTDPAAADWFAGKVRGLVRRGADAIKADFGERIPTDVVWHDGSDPALMHNYYSLLYNRTVFEAIEAERGHGQAVLFARSATVGGQRFPVHWGGDCESTYVAMAESLPRRPVARPQRVRVLEPRHRRVRGHAHPGVVQAVAAVRVAVVARPPPRLGLVPGALGVRRGIGRGRPAFHAPAQPSRPVPLERRRGSERTRPPDDAGDGAGVPRRPVVRPARPPVPARRRPARRPGDVRRRAGGGLPTGRSLDRLSRRPAGRRSGVARRAARVRLAAVVRAARSGDPDRRGGGPPRLRPRRPSDLRGVRTRRRGDDGGTAARPGRATGGARRGDTPRPTPHRLDRERRRHRRVVAALGHGPDRPGAVE